MRPDELGFAVAILERLVVITDGPLLARLRALLIEGRAQLERERFFSELAIDLQFETLQVPEAVTAYADLVETQIRQRRAVWP